MIGSGPPIGPGGGLRRAARPVVGLVAVVTYLGRGDVMATVAVLVVACSCAFALATPVAMLASIGVESIEELFAAIPRDLRLNRPLDIGPALSEIELTAI